MLRDRAKVNNQFGDTIVEVMIVLAVLGLALGISYSTANRSLLNARQAQEATQATELVQSQAEELRALSASASSDTSHYIYTNQTFCITGAGVTAQVTVPPPANACDLGEDNRYAVTINWSGVATDEFTIVATWDDITGRGQDTTTLIYRLHKPS